VRILLPIAFAIVVGYGAAASATGKQQAQIEENRRMTEALQKNDDYQREVVEQLRKGSISKEQFDMMMNLLWDTRKDLTEIRNDLRRR
jgi:hypothetical protein